MLRFKLFLDLLWGRAERLIARAGFRVAAQEASIPCPLPAPPSALWWDLGGFLQNTYLPTFQYLQKNVRTYKNIKEKLVLLVFWPLPLSPPEGGRGKKLGGVENGSLRTGSGGFPGELKRRGKSPKPKGRRPKPAPCTPRKCFSLTRRGRCAGQSTQPGSCP